MHPLRGHGRIVGIGTKTSDRVSPSGNKHDRAQCSRIIEHDLRPVIEVNRRSWVSRGHRFRPGNPITRHAEMRVKHSTVLEIDELVLAATANAGDSDSCNRSPLRGRDASPERGMMDLQRGDATSNDEWPKRNDGALDLGKLRQRSLYRMGE
jgi:hypothetical protein